MKTTLRILSAALLVVALLLVGTCAYLFSFYHANSTADLNRDCIVVFGAAVWPGGNPSDALRDRMETALDIYEHGGPRCLVLSGADSVYGRHEVDVMLDIAYERDVEYADVEVDYHGINTKQTIENLDTTRSYILVSSDFHLARISLLARQAGIENFSVYASTYRQGRYAHEGYFIVREVVAFWYYLLVA